MPKVKSVISIGVGGNTRGAWGVSAKALTFFGSTEARAYKIAYGLAFYIEHTFGIPAVYCPPDMDSEAGARTLGAAYWSAVRSRTCGVVRPVAPPLLEVRSHLWRAAAAPGR